MSCATSKLLSRAAAADCSHSAGRLAFDGGKYKGTTIDELLPVSLTGGPVDDANSFTPVYKPVLTGAGQAHPITRLNEDRGANQKTWNELPPISVSEVLTNVKPGASVLLEARRVEGAVQVAPLLVQQRYGRGQTLALTAADTWRWKMRMDAKNNAHETFWRQMLRYLVSGTPRQVEIGLRRRFTHSTTRSTSSPMFGTSISIRLPMRMRRRA